MRKFEKEKKEFEKISVAGLISQNQCEWWILDRFESW